MEESCCANDYEIVSVFGFVSTENVDPRASVILDIKCPASGEAERNYWDNLIRLRREKDEVKFVIADLDDWKFAKEIIAKYDLTGHSREILISPVHGLDGLPIGQRVPLNRDRDNVRPAYLQAVRVAVLNAAFDLLATGDEATAPWCKLAGSDPDCSDHAIKHLIHLLPACG